MIINHFKGVRRNLGRNKVHSTLNIAGLTAGLTCFALIALWVNDEMNYDRFHEKFEDIYRLTTTSRTGFDFSESAMSNAQMASSIVEDFAGVENTVRLDLHRDELVLHDNEQILESNILMTDPSFFDVFSYSLSRGNVTTALEEPYSIILTQSIARKYFGDSNPMGESLTIFMNDSTGLGTPYRVTGVMPDPPKNSHFTFNILASFKTEEVSNPEILTPQGFDEINYYTYLLLRKGVDPKSLSNKITQSYGRNHSDTNQLSLSYDLQPLKDIHLKSHLQNEIAATGNINQVYVFSVIGILILLLAGINYTNLATAISLDRAKEVMIKKTIGAGKGHLVSQYLLESVTMTFIALFLSLILSIFLQPIFQEITGKSLNLFTSPFLLSFLIGITFLLGLLSGIYPTIALLSFSPAKTLKSAYKSGTFGMALRRALITFQFIITLVLVASIVIMYSQMSFISTKDLGYKEDAHLVLRVNGNSDVVNGYGPFKNQLLQSPLISGITVSNTMLGGSIDQEDAVTVDTNGNPVSLTTSSLGADRHFFDVHRIGILAGKNFAETEIETETRPVILNEMAAKVLGLENIEEIIGKPFNIDGQDGIVVGVTNNFHYNSLKQNIGPLLIYPINRFSRITLKVDIENANQVIEMVERVWKENFPTALFDYGFLEEHIQMQYEAEKRFSKILLIFSILSLLISCLGLIGLITYTARQRTKEIGVKKVLGAKTSDIAVMLGKEFLMLLVPAFLLSIPISWLGMNRWIQDFAYRVNITWWMFLSAGVIVALIALLSVGFQGIKAARANPVRSLRNE
ncbi:ABC transporter permease [Flagellimonas sp.]|uniref:ABC transporter permease n=1 Tax=Flagellimonas sp. TaxID=2058762 RepID=UPI003F49DB93